MQGMSCIMQGMVSAINEASLPTGITAPTVAQGDRVQLRWHARELRGTRTLAEAARLVGLNRDELGRIERGETRQIRFDTLVKLVEGYRCTLADLIEVVPATGPAPLYAGAVAAFAAGGLGAPRRRSVIGRTAAADRQDLGEAATPEPGPPPRKVRRRPLGTLAR
jgi:DNA-binding Xre family transcriptional regulator